LGVAELGAVAGLVELGVSADGLVELEEFGVAAGGPLELLEPLKLEELCVAAGVTAAVGVDGPELAANSACAELADGLGTCQPVVGPLMASGGWLTISLAPTAPVANAATARILATTPVAPSPPTPAAA
jgi:hypothetical protein